MSVDASKPGEETPVVDTTIKALPEQPEASTAATETPAAPAETTEATPAAAEEPAAATTEEPKKDETVVEAVPASEGVLGYKEPTFFKKFIYTKHYFWFSEEPSTAESLIIFLRSEKADAKHSSAAWARETGKGLLFFSKRAEDKATPAGVINLSDASPVVKEGFDQFSFKAGSHQHRFEAATSKERDSWVVAVEKAIEEAKGLKDDILGRDSYKKNVEEYSKPAFAPVAVKTPRSKSKEPKKSLDATAAAAAAAPAPTADNATSASSDADETSKPKDERSQSRKRGSIFGTLLGKKDDAEKKEEKKEVKEEKKAEAEEKKEEAKATKEPGSALDAAEASAAAAVPAAVVAADKKEEKEDVSPTDKRAKRGSVFGTFFKNRVTSPTTEKSEKEAANPDVPPVSETAPKIDEPIENKPIDTAAVTAPVDTVETPAATSEEPAKDATPATAETSTAHKSDKKGGFLGFIKKTEAILEGKKEHKEEAKEEDKAADVPANTATGPAEATSTEPGTEAPAATEERPARDNKRRTSLFYNKKKSETSDAEDPAAEPKREKSPLPGGKFIGQLVRRASKAIKSEGPKEKSAAEPTATTEATTAETPATAAEDPETKAADPVPEPAPSAPEPVATTTAPEVKATA